MKLRVKWFWEVKMVTLVYIVNDARSDKKKPFNPSFSPNPK
jgi:hypothetical protein